MQWEGIVVRYGQCAPTTQVPLAPSFLPVCTCKQETSVRMGCKRHESSTLSSGIMHAGDTGLDH